ncbi:MAG TPA: hypothetical protein VH414_06160 [Lichenihabitans sp.]|nr:hypothetical protein [Lichenihabitans sp.]
MIGQLLAAPPAKGELKAVITALAARTWQHPTTGDQVQFGFATIERWYYRALKERADPVGVLRRKLRADAGQQVAIGDAVRQAVLAQLPRTRAGASSSITTTWSRWPKRGPSLSRRRPTPRCAGS